MLRQVINFIAAIGYKIAHPFEVFNVTIVRRYVDAQDHFISELYQGDGRDSIMLGMSCDNMPLNADAAIFPLKPTLCWSKSFLEPMPYNTLRVGAMEPKDNASTQAYVARRRWQRVNVTVLNRFVEPVLEAKI